jgi:hypothetical protein
MPARLASVLIVLQERMLIVVWENASNQTALEIHPVTTILIPV